MQYIPEDFGVDQQFVDSVAGALDDEGEVGSQSNYDLPDITDISGDDQNPTTASDKMRMKHMRSVRGEKGSELSNLTAIKAVQYLVRALNKFGQGGITLKDWKVKFHSRGFDIVDIKLKLDDPQLKRDIAKRLRESYPGSRHDFDKNPTVYTFLAIHPTLGRAIRDKMGLDYAAYDDGRGGISISISNPPAELPFPEDAMEDEEEDEEVAPEDIPGIGGAGLEGGPGMAMPGGMGGAGMGPGSMGGMEPGSMAGFGGLPEAEEMAPGEEADIEVGPGEELEGEVEGGLPRGPSRPTRPYG